MEKKDDKRKSLCWIGAGAVVGTILFVLGELDDAPGLCFIGLLAAFLMLMRGLYFGKVIRKGYCIPIILLVLGCIVVVFPIILFLDSEIGKDSPLLLAGPAVGIAMLAVAAVKLRRNQNKSD